jgi:4-diphosphocytidyl-2-C-methyl-D-erythritol kinase
MTGTATPQTTVEARAKLTVSLRVVGVRDDGYHLLDAEMVSLALADTLVMAPGDGLSIEVDARLATVVDDIPVGADNLVRRALALMEQTASVTLKKRIPPGGGLGGGSSDAAAVLRWAGCSDLSLAARLGADVPFCVIGGRARVTGIGDEVDPLPFVDRSYVLVLPPFGVNTAAVYRAYDELARDATARSSAPGTNDLEAAALLVEPRLTAWREALAAHTGTVPQLAGSGSTWFYEGTPATIGLEPARGFQVGRETGVVVATRTAPPEGSGGATHS